jgi:hypothetical protein
MATPNLGMTLPTPGGDTGIWGTTLNSDLTILDNVFSSSGTSVSMNIGSGKQITVGGTITQTATGIIITGTDGVSPSTSPIAGGGIRAPSAVAGMTNQIGYNLTLYGGASTGSGAGGSVSIYTMPAGSAGSSLNTNYSVRLQVVPTGDVVVGSGEATTSLSGGILRAPSGAGANVTGAALAIQAGNGTGSGGSGSIVLSTAQADVSSSTANTMAARITITSAGYSQFTSGAVGVQATSSATSYTPDFRTNNNFYLTPTGSITLVNPTYAPQAGQSGIFVIQQPSGGSAILTLGTSYKTPSGAGLVLSTAGNAIDVIPWYAVSSTQILLGYVIKAFA